MIQPLGKRILIEPIIKEKKEGILILKEEEPQKFKVLAIGDDVKKVSINDSIIIGSFTTSEFTLDGKKNIFINEDNIIAKVS